MEKIDLIEQKRVAKEIMFKYNDDLVALYDKATSSELKSVMMYIANESNHKQRIIAGID